MPELSKEFIDQFLADKEWIEGKVQEVVTRMYDIRSTEPPCSFHVDEIDATIIALSGEETWQYGGRECYQLSIPTSYLYDPDWESAYRLKVEAEQAEARAKADREKKSIEREERKRLAELKVKYEGGRMPELTLPEQRARLDWIRQHPEFLDLPEYDFILDLASERLEQLEREAVSEAQARYASCQHDWKEEYYGVKCNKCDSFHALCRWNILGKVPFEPGKTPLMKARREQDSLYVNNRTAQTMMQQVGRGTRNATDWCENFIIDDSIGWFKYRYPGLFQKWFKIRDVSTVPGPLRRVA